jgi:hypothetical protein
MKRFASAFPRMVGHGAAPVSLVMLVLIAGFPVASGPAMDGVAHAASSNQFDVSGSRARQMVARTVNTARPDARRSLATTAGGTIQFGVPTTFTVSTGGETAWMTFSGSAGMRVSMTTSMSGTWSAKILDATTGQIVASCSTNCNGGSNFIDATPLPFTPDVTLYKVQLTANVAGNATITLYNVPDDLSLSTTPLAGNGAAVPISIVTPGQNAVITFQGRKGERLSWAHSDATSLYNTTLRDQNNPNTILVSCGTYCNGGSAFLEPFPLPADGTYKVVFDPSYTWRGSKTITFYDVPDDLAFSTTPVSGGGAAVPISINTPGQNAVITFQGRQGERLSWTHSDATSVYSTTLRNTNNAVLVSCGYSCNGGSAFLEPFSLTAAGTYKVVFDPGYTWKGSKTIKLYDVPDDLAVSLTPASPATSVTLPIDTPGRNAQITFQGYAGQTLSWTQTSTIPVYATRLYRDVSLITSCGYACNGYTGTLNPFSLASDGTYRVVFDPSYSYTGSHTITLKLTPGGSAAISGFANVGEQLTASASFSTPPATSLTYQWQRCDPAGTSCVDLFGQTTALYSLVDSDLGSRLRVKITATNAQGSTTSSKLSLLVLPRISTLAINYRPALMFDSGEHWRPLDADSFLEEGIHQLCVRYEAGEVPGLPVCKAITDASTFKHGPIDPVTQQEQNTYSLDTGAWWSYVEIGAIGGSASDASSYKSPNSACYGQPSGSVVVLRDCDSGNSATIYYDYGQDASGFRYIDYWFFYRYNQITGDNHQGDWEGLTTVLDGSSPDPRVAGVIFAQHGKLTWDLPTSLCWGVTCELTQPQGSGHVTTFPASGTHASYEFVCPDSCPNPEGSLLPEGDHDGAASWSMNTDSACLYGLNCVKPLPAGAERWTIWPGTWGSDPGSAFVEGTSASPHSPGTKARYTCTQTGWACPERQWSRSTPRVTTGIPSPKLCRNWGGVSVVVLACDPAVLNRTIQRHQTVRRGPFHIKVLGRRSGDTAGLVQVVGLPLRPGEVVHFSGRPTANTSLLIRVQTARGLFGLTARKIELISGTGALRIVLRGRKPAIASSRGVRLSGLRVELLPTGR